MAQRISKIISGMRALNRDGSMDPFELTSVHKLLEESLYLVGHYLKNSQIEVILEPVPDHLFIQCRVVQITQVFVNLLKNAHDAIEDLPDKWIHLHTKVKGDYVEFRFIDSGNGIPMEIQEKMKTAFYTSKSVGKGTGLGLHITRKIIQEHSGKIYIDNNHKNTCFVIELPKKQEVS